MKRYIRSSYNEPYIPDMTERYPEGMRGPDMYDYDDPEDVMWSGMEDDYWSALKDRLERWSKMSDEEFQNLSESERQEYYDDMEEWNEHMGSDYNPFESYSIPEVDDSIMITQGYVGSNSTGDTVGSYGKFTYGGYWVKTVNREAHFDDEDEIDAYLEEKGLHKENRL